MTAVSLEVPHAREILGRATLYELLALAFAYPEPEGLAQLSALARAAREDGDTMPPGLASAVDALADAACGADPAHLAGQHNRLFAGQVPCSGHETEYLADHFAKGRQLADIAGFYRAFGLQAVGERGHAPDFISVELEFMGVLLRKALLAAARGWHEQEEICLDAQRAFLGQHLGRWVPAFRQRLADLDSEPPHLYRAAAEACARLVRAETARLEVEPLPLPARLPVVDDLDAAFTCGGCPAEQSADETPAYAHNPDEATIRE